MQTTETGLPPVRILAGLSEEALEMLSRESERQVFKPGKIIIGEGEAGNRMFLIESGRVRVFKKAQDLKEVDLAMLGPGDCFGEGCILTTLPRVASVQALTEVTVYSLSSMTFYRLYRTLPDQYSILVLNIARELSRRLRELDESFAGCH